MNKRTKNFLPTLIIALIILVSGLFVFVFAKAEIRQLLRQKDYLIVKINERNNSIEMKTVEVQKLSSETRIVQLVELKLGMIKNQTKSEVITINREKLNQVKELIRLKYE